MERRPMSLDESTTTQRDTASLLTVDPAYPARQEDLNRDRVFSLATCGALSL